MKKQFLILRSCGKLFKIDINTILFLQVDNDNCLLVTSDFKARVHHSMKSILKSLPHDQFFQVHRSFSVNVDAVTAVSRNEFKIGELFIPASPGFHREALYRRFLANSVTVKHVN